MFFFKGVRSECTNFYLLHPKSKVSFHDQKTEADSHPITRWFFSLPPTSTSPLRWRPVLTGRGVRRSWCRSPAGQELPGNGTGPAAPLDVSELRVFAHSSPPRHFLPITAQGGRSWEARCRAPMATVKSWCQNTEAFRLRTFNCGHGVKFT